MSAGRHVVSGEVIGYWLARGEAVVRRLKAHGVPAKCEAQQVEVPGATVVRLHFEMGTFAKIIEAERIADALDEELEWRKAREARGGEES